MASIIGQMEAIIKEILSKEFAMDMVFGKMKKKYIKVTIEWIKKKALESINGFINKSIKESSKMIIAKGTDSFPV